MIYRVSTGQDIMDLSGFGFLWISVAAQPRYAIFPQQDFAKPDLLLPNHTLSV
uniref:Uncharacterized protein n=1 Tax=Candidatus Kentrum sp. SD TaxID=2126332 RepID=A0A450Y576_9GAMM|nr:MAG: hypothetical protein BECKSD772F_GA0070984_100418 [Candidatus Kentron sp. SD]VFK40208.1 MAG: hypothetical protein BECKSD772E_GA0070983_100518 [Candidatus Kentron sp. SD]VFK79093.1 MAG: hypothetical protein BECKSD772D_GA0070982_103519 [Candidatus Kentron sp. SD]